MKGSIAVVSLLSHFVLIAHGQPNNCNAGEDFICKDGKTPTKPPPACSSGKPQCCIGGLAGTCRANQKVANADNTATATCKTPTCASPPCAASLVGTVGCTTRAATAKYDYESIKKGATIAKGTKVYGPFEPAITKDKDSLIKGWGCTDPTVAYDPKGGLDVTILEQKVSKVCNVQLPRIEGDSYKGIVDWCGGQSSDGTLADYHFHRSLGCLFKPGSAKEVAHSLDIAEVAGHKLYGKWEDASKNLLPLLDACGAHFGPVPGGTGHVYHYHVQDKPPFTVGCLGPDTGNKLMSVARCRKLYEGGDAQNRGCTASGYASIEVKRHGGVKTISYDRYCPCFDADGSNIATNIKELPALNTQDISYKAPSTTTTTTKAASTRAAPSSKANDVSGSSHLSPTLALMLASSLMFLL